MAGAVEKVLRLVLDVRSVRTGSQSFRRDLQGIGTAARKGSTDVAAANASLQKMGGTLGKMTSLLGAFGIAFTGAFAIGATVRTLASFGAEMSRVQAVTSATAEQMGALTAQARTLGATTRYSATQAAEGMVFLGQAGFNTNQILEASGPALRLAQAGAIGLAESADIASNVISGMNLEVSEFAGVADVMALTAARTNTNVLQMGEALKYVAPVAAATGQSVQTMAAAIGILGNSGIQATMAGTSLRMIMSDLVAPSDTAAAVLKDMGINAADLGKILQDPGQGLISALELLREKGLGATEAFKVFGARGAPAVLALTSQVGDLRDFVGVLGTDAPGAADRMAAVMDDNLAGAFKRLKSAMEELIHTAGDAGVTGSLRSLVETMAGVARGLSGQQESIAKYGGQIAWLKGILMALIGLKVAAWLHGISLSLAGGATAATGFIGVFGPLLVIIAGATKVLSGYIDKWKAASQEQIDAMTGAQGLADAMREVQAVAASGQDWIAADTLKRLGDEIDNLIQKNSELREEYGDLTTEGRKLTEQDEFRLGFIPEELAANDNRIKMAERLIAQVSGLKVVTQEEGDAAGDAAKRERELAEALEKREKATKAVRDLTADFLDAAQPLNEFQQRIKDLSEKFMEQAKAAREAGVSNDVLREMAERYGQAIAAVHADEAAAEAEKLKKELEETKDLWEPQPLATYREALDDVAASMDSVTEAALAMGEQMGPPDQFVGPPAPNNGTLPEIPTAPKGGGGFNWGRMLAGLQFAQSGDQGQALGALIESIAKLRETSKKAAEGTEEQAIKNKEIASTAGAAASAFVGLLDSMGMLNKDQQKWSQLGGQLGGMIGSAWGPVGAAVGQGAGQILGVIVGAFTASAKKTFTRFQADAGEIIGQLEESSSGLDDAADGMTSAIADAFNNIAEMLGGSISSVGDLAFQVFENRKGEQSFKVWVDGVKKVFETQEEAINDAITRGLKTVQFKGISDVARAALENFAGETLDELQATIAKALAVEELGIPEMQRGLHRALSELVDLFRWAIDNLAGIGAENVLGEFVRISQDARDAALGISQSQEEQMRRRIDAYNAERAVQIAQLQTMKAEMEARLADVESRGAATVAHQAATNAFLQMERDVIGGFGAMAGAGAAFADAAAATAGVQNDAADTIRNSIALIDQALASMPAEISPDEANRAIRGIGADERQRDAEQRRREEELEAEAMRRGQESLADLTTEFNRMAGRTNPLQDQLDDLNDRFEEEMESAQELGLVTEDLVQAYGAARQATIDNYNAQKDIERQQKRAQTSQLRADVFGFAAGIFEKLGDVEKAAELRAKQEFILFKLSMMELQTRIATLKAEGRNLAQTEALFGELLELTGDWTWEDFVVPVAEAGNQFRNDVENATSAWAEAQDRIISGWLDFFGQSQQNARPEGLLGDIADIKARKTGLGDLGALTSDQITELIDKVNAMGFSIPDLVEGSTGWGSTWQWHTNRPEVEAALWELVEELQKAEFDKLGEKLKEPFTELEKKMRTDPNGPVSRQDQLNDALEAFEKMKAAFDSGDATALEGGAEILQQLLTAAAGAIPNGSAAFAALQQMVFDFIDQVQEADLGGMLQQNASDEPTQGDNAIIDALMAGKDSNEERLTDVEGAVLDVAEAIDEMRRDVVTELRRVAGGGRI